MIKSLWLLTFKLARSNTQRKHRRMIANLEHELRQLDRQAAITSGERSESYLVVTQALRNKIVKLKDRHNTGNVSWVGRGYTSTRSDAALTLTQKRFN